MAAAVAAMFRDTSVTSPATWFPGGQGGGRAVRVVLQRPDEIETFGASRIGAEHMRLEMAVADAPELAAGDVLAVSGTRYAVRGAPRTDETKMIWQAELVEE